MKVENGSFLIGATILLALIIAMRAFITYSSYVSVVKQKGSKAYEMNSTSQGYGGFENFLIISNLVLVGIALGIFIAFEGKIRLTLLIIMAVGIAIDFEDDLVVYFHLKGIPTISSFINNYLKKSD